MINKLTVAVLVGITSPYVAAQTTTDIKAPATHSYNQNSSGVITRSEFGLCWRSGSWSENDAIAGCDGALASPVPNPTAPEIANNMSQEAPALSNKSCELMFALGGDQAFAFNKAELSKLAKRQIDTEVLPHLAECKQTESLTITGHTDNLGSIPANLMLSEKRAKSVANYLKAKGITAKMNLNGAGSSQALKTCGDKLKDSNLIQCLAPNRRVLIVMTRSEK